MVRIVARVLWVFPVLLLALCIDQAKLACDLQSTWRHGVSATAKVVAWEQSRRADVTYGYISLRVPLAGGGTLVKDRMSLPYSLLPQLEDADSLGVRVQPGAPQDVVVESLMPAHRLIAAAQAGISLAGAMMLAVALFAWNRWLRKHPER